MYTCLDYIRNEEQGWEISSSFFIIRLAKIKEIDFNSESFACQICMFGYWENEAEDKFSLAGFERKKIAPDQSVWNSFRFGPVHILKKSQLLVRLDFLAQTGPEHEHLVC